MANYHSGSTPVAGLYERGYNTIVTEGSPVYVIPAPNHPRRMVRLVWDDGTEMWDGTDNGLPRTTTAVPVPTAPDGGRFEPYYGRELWGAGPDQQLTIYDPYTDELWEFWLFRWDDTAQEYRARWAGYMPDASTGPVTFPHTWGARATGIPLRAGQIRPESFTDGQPRGPLGVAIPVVLPGFIPPAVREDENITWHTVGNDGRDAVPEGAWFRLPPGYPVNTDRYPGEAERSLVYALLVRAARDFGIVVYDGTGGSTSFAFQGTGAVGTPYSDVQSATVPQNTTDGGPFWGTNNVLLDFPWYDLEQIKYGA